MLRWMMESMWDSAADSVKTSVDSVKNETRLITDKAYDLATLPSPEKQKQRLEEFKKTHEEARRRQEERKAAHQARFAVDTSEDAQQLAKCKEEIDVVLQAVNNEIAAINQSYTPFLWRFSMNEKIAEKDALLVLYTAHSFKELKLLVEQQVNNPNLVGNKRMGGLSEHIQSAERIARCRV
jgi:hypothetical protein